MSYILLSSFIVMLASLSGVVLLWRSAGVFVDRNLKFLVSLSAGVFLVIAFGMGGEAVEHSTSIQNSTLWILAGIVGVFIIFKLLPTFHHHHDEAQEGYTHSRLDVNRIILGDAMHNLADGILLVSAFAVNPALGIFTTISIFLHEMVQEVSEFFVMKQAGFSTKKALLINFAVSSTILIGSLGSFFLLERFKALEVPLLGISAGVFFVVVFFDLIPHSVRHSTKRIQYVTHLAWFLIGVGLMFSVFTLSPHGHEEAHHVELQDDHVDE